VDDARFCQSNAQNCVTRPVEILAQKLRRRARRRTAGDEPLLVKAKAIAHVDAKAEGWLIAVNELLLAELAQALVEFPSLPRQGEIQRKYV
jgi:hypothetical protein